ncbi:nuclear transport factor 2 family protein [[Mycobacterium] crassicus]|uniref:Nuclear transport factor 2 family protein n=1 Tax=[Mycobacterium] crassicus TaxID=2872309 RepID=A0ABU5XGJ4_9MYCO|nr:nuclear transport factor 2 family protein [Mycolicibacter sp. MYC098]MEB3021379.1 nuclear transport factor 2 family protein [Mycolicibacter sp. MYC098]
MYTITAPYMPPAVVAYFAAMNRHDTAGMAALFPPDGLINDIQRDFWGAAAITRFLDREITGDEVVATRVVESKQHYGDYIVAATIDGEYDKTGVPDPLILTFYFSLAGDQISRLIILANRPAD